MPRSEFPGKFLIAIRVWRPGETSLKGESHEDRPGPGSTRTHTHGWVTFFYSSTPQHRFDALIFLCAFPQFSISRACETRDILRTGVITRLFLPMPREISFGITGQNYSVQRGLRGLTWRGIHVHVCVYMYTVFIYIKMYVMRSW